jgi:hypothetical protein
MGVVFILSKSAVAVALASEKFHSRSRSAQYSQYNKLQLLLFSFTARL